MRLLVLSIMLFAAACGAPEPPLAATDVEVTRPMPGMHMSAGFLVLTNNTAETIEISGVTSPQFESVEIHETTIEDGISRMRKLDKLVVPAGGSTTLERGGKHLMLMRPRNLQDFVTLHLMSDDALVLTVDYSFPMDKD
jgi:copper(I)-binding protein